MSTQQLKSLSIGLWVVAALLVVGLIASYPLLATYRAPQAPTPQVTSTPKPKPTPSATPEPPTPTPEWKMPDDPYPTFAGTLPPTATPWQGINPTYIRIPDIDLEAPVVPIGWKTVEVRGTPQAMWDVPDWRAAGWHEISMPLRAIGNTVLNGHNTTKGEVFRDLYKLEAGALIMMEGEDGGVYTYTVQEVLILPEAGQPLEVRIANAAYTQPTDDERLTLVTCHPYGSLDNRLIVIAYPVPLDETSAGGE